MPAIGLLGGTFDPIHLGHLALAESAREAFGLAGVVLVPAGQPPHKPGAVMAPARDRLRMVEIATDENPHFSVSTVEIERTGPSYTVDTVVCLRRQQPAVDWCLIVGSDALAEIPTWHDYQRLLSLVRILAAARPGTPLALPPEIDARSARIDLFYPPSLEISASSIRQRIRDGLSVRYLVPTEVIAYLTARRLYRDDAVSPHGYSRRPAAGK